MPVFDRRAGPHPATRHARGTTLHAGARRASDAGSLREARSERRVSTPGFATSANQKPDCPFSGLVDLVPLRDPPLIPAIKEAGMEDKTQDKEYAKPSIVDHGDLTDLT